MNVDQIFKKNGPLSKYLSGYNPRPGQVALANAVESSLREGRHLLAEGPTGTGKSLAYGIPAAVHALTHSESVVIATANIALQEQLAKKDLPLIKNLMQDLELGELEFFSRKGIGNYVCLYKLEELVTEEKLPWAKQLRNWIAENRTGDKEEMPVDYHEKWNDVKADRDECHQTKCRYYDDCYAYQARMMSAKPGCIIVTNYHMLYADCIVRGATNDQFRLLPEYTVAIMDEAHEAVDIARGFQGYELTMSQLWWLIKRFGKYVKKSDVSVDAVRGCGTRFFEELAEYHADFGGVFDKPLGFGRELIEALDACSKSIVAYSKKIRGSEEEAMVLRLAELMKRRALQYRDACYGQADPKGPLFPEDDGEEETWTLKDGTVYYTEKVEGAQRSSAGQSVKLCAKVIEVQDFLREWFLDNTTLIATSATLSTKGNFNFIAKEFGLDDDEYASLIAPSPFNPRKMLVVVPSNFPNPKQRDQHTYFVNRSIEQVVKELGGRSMALFTSYRSLTSAANYLEKRLPGVELLVQGKMPRGRIVEHLKKDERGLILATTSFWQGVDIPGRALSCLFIEKFPFAPPTDPVMCYMEAKTKKRGDRTSAFFHYSIPKAVIALKQGVGRLIRQETDYGAVILFDTRLETERYGEHFESAFPEDHYRTDDLLEAVRFIREHDSEAECA